MAFGMSREPLFVSCLPEDNMVSSMRIADGYLMEGIMDRVGDCYEYGDEIDNCDTSEHCSSEDTLHKDILDLLPDNPFGMDMSTTFTAITSWLEDINVDYQGHGCRQTCTGETSYSHLTEFDVIWNNDAIYHSFVDDFGSESNFVGLDYPCFNSDIDKFCSYDSADDDAARLWVDEAQMSMDENVHMVCSTPGELKDEEVGVPHVALNYVLSHLGIRDILMMETVCKSLQYTIRNDPLLWRNISIDQPLNEKLTDEILIQLASKSQGSLHCLCLVECPWVTDDALKHVLETNPRISKLCVPGCTRLSIDGVLACLKALKNTGAPGVKQLRVGGLFGVTMDHFEKIKLLLDADDQASSIAVGPHFYHKGNLYLSCDDERAIDIESCPRCQNMRLVYDCPLDACEGPTHSAKHCRACTLCIPRCIQCGRCICDGEYEETFCLELICSECWQQQFMLWQSE